MKKKAVTPATMLNLKRLTDIKCIWYMGLYYDEHERDIWCSQRYFALLCW